MPLNFSFLIFENILIIAHENNTDVLVNDSTTPVNLVNAGDWVVIEGDKYTLEGNLYVATSKNVFAYQGIGGEQGNPTFPAANQGMFFVPPLSEVIETLFSIIGTPV